MKDYLGREVVDLRELADARSITWEYEQSFAAERAQWRGEDAPWLVGIPCRRGVIYPCGLDQLSAWPASPYGAKAIFALDGAGVTQRGDDEQAIRLPVRHLDAVLDILRPNHIQGELPSWDDRAAACVARWKAPSQSQPNKRVPRRKAA